MNKEKKKKIKIRNKDEERRKATDIKSKMSVCILYVLYSDIYFYIPFLTVFLHFNLVKRDREKHNIIYYKIKG